MAENTNPFVSLFASSEAVQTAKESTERHKIQLDATISRIFLIKAGMTECRPDDPKYVLILEQDGGLLTLENYEKALVERLQIKNPSQHLVIKSKGVHHNIYDKVYATENVSLNYLADCYGRLLLEYTLYNEVQHWKNDTLVLIKCKIVQMAAIVTCSTHRQNALLAKSSSQSDFVTLFMKTISQESKVSLDFFKDIAQSQDSGNLSIIFNPLLNYIYEQSTDLSLTSSNYGALADAVVFFCQVPSLATFIVNSPYWLPDERIPQTGKAFQTHTLLGRFLSPTSLGPSLLEPSSYFNDVQFPITRDLELLINDLQSCLEHNIVKLRSMFSALFRQGEEVKERVLIWLVNCFMANKDRSKILSRIQSAGPLLTTASDGFFLNLSWVLLYLSSPFTACEENGAINPRLMIIDPGYCTLGKEGYNKPFIDFSKETKLSSREPTSAVELVKPTVPVKFISHCFFLTHECLILGLTQTIHMCKDVTRMINRLAFDRMNGRGGMIEHERMLQKQYFGIRAHALDPYLLRLCLTFYTATASWLVELVKQDCSDNFPLLTAIPVKLQNLPECLVENLCDFAMFLRFVDSNILSDSYELQEQLITFCTIFMGNTYLLSNPHLRAKLAQLISMMIPPEKSQGLLQIAYVDTQRMLFENHSIACQHLFTSLLTIFIDIEHTGDSMEFEDKFTYRIPMYGVIKFLWSIPAYHQNLVAIGDEVDMVQSSVVTPLFLRFMNMMINDATLQLDEGLQNLSVIREVQILKDSPQWMELTAEEKKDHLDKMNEAIMYARNRNTLALKTVNTLELITTSITKPFVNKAIVDQIAAMLNYFLQQLLGPRSKDLIVKDREKYNFDPRELICGIISIYINLGREQEFCQAVPRDGRSFSMGLFDQALNILRRLGKPDELCLGLIKMRESVKKELLQLKIEEEMMDDAPEEFLDPLMNEIMSDPVILPTSGKIMDRTVVMRHLLSDQTDPFNREPLTVDKLIPHEELKKRINEWKLAKTQSLSDNS